jgi:ligand-binding sensor domain-containing protein
MYKLLLLLFATTLFAAPQWAVEPIGQLDDAEIYDLCIIENQVWCATTAGVRIWDISRDLCLTADGLPDALYCQAIAATGPRNIWVATLKQGLYHFDGQSWNRFSRPEGLPGNRVNDVVFDQTQRLWVATDRGLYIYDQGFKPVSFSHHARASVLGLESGPSGVLAELEGGAIYALTSDSSELLVAADGSFRKRVRQDHAGHVWFSENKLTDTARIVSDSPALQHSALPADLNDNLVVPFIVTQEQTLMVGRQGGLSIFDREWQTLSLDDKARVTVIMQDKADRIWVAAGNSLYTIANSEQQLAPFAYTLECRNYPNPFNPETTFSFTLEQDGMTSMKIYDVLGRQVALLTNQSLAAGPHTISWNAANQASGVYYAVLQTAGQTMTHKILLQK